MWLPTTIYESLPALYFAVGLLFLSGVAYTGVHNTWGAVYLALGVFSVLSGIAIHVLRKKARDARTTPRPPEGGERDSR